MATVTIYFVTHKLGRTDTSTADADAIVRQVNDTTGSNGDSRYRDRVQAELDSLTNADIQALYGITVESEEVEVDEYPSEPGPERPDIQSIPGRDKSSQKRRRIDAGSGGGISSSKTTDVAAMGSGRPENAPGFLGVISYQNSKH